MTRGTITSLCRIALPVGDGYVAFDTAIVEDVDLLARLEIAEEATQVNRAPDGEPY